MNDDGMTAACGGHDAEAQRQTLLLYFQRLTSLGNFLAKHVTTVVKVVFETSLRFSISTRVSRGGRAGSTSRGKRQSGISSTRTRRRGTSTKQEAILLRQDRPPTHAVPSVPPPLQISRDDYSLAAAPQPRY